MDVELKLFEVFQVLFKQTVKHGHVFHEHHFLLVQTGLNLIDLNSQRSVRLFEVRHFFEKGTDYRQIGQHAFSAILLCFEFVNLFYQVGKQGAGRFVIRAFHGRQDAV